MADDLKRFYDRRVVESLAQDFSRAWPAFDATGFVSQCVNGLDRLELLARAWHIAEAMNQHLPGAFPKAAKVLVRSLPRELQGVELHGMEVFRYLPHVFYVSKYGIDSFEEAMHAQYELTKRFTAEFSIRPFLVRYPEQTLARLRDWSADPNVHVRRLVSESTRPRLPWAPRLRAFQENPAPVLDLLDLLKDDPELYVRRSVANSLNDIGKDHPDMAVSVCREWVKEASRERQWIVKHALRSLVKKGHLGAMTLMGAGDAPKIRIERVSLSPRNPKVGGRLAVSFELVSTARTQQTLVVDYAVFFVKANGKTAPKVFKLKRLEVPAGARVNLSCGVSFGPMTTRKHYPGLHSLEARVNGRPYALGTVRLLGE